MLPVFSGKMHNDPVAITFTTLLPFTAAVPGGNLFNGRAPVPRVGIFQDNGYTVAYRDIHDYSPLYGISAEK